MKFRYVKSSGQEERKETMSNKTIVGISASHDASACIFRNGQLEVAIQLERITRKKHDGKPYLFTAKAIEYCLNALGITVNDIDLFAFNAMILPGWVGLSQPCFDESFKIFDPYGEKSLYVSHHLAHAFSTFYASSFDEATVIVADGSGGSVLGAEDLIIDGPMLKKYLSQENRVRPQLQVQSTYIFNLDSFELIEREEADSFNTRSGSTSLGEVYAAVSEYVFDNWIEGGKLMGLAPYGNDGLDEQTFLFEDENGRLQFASNWKNKYTRTLGKKNPLDYKDLAARVQKDFETALLQRFRRAINLTNIKNVAYAGGLALNSVANERIWQELEIDDFFILPASNDAGISIGCAAAADYFLNRKMPKISRTYHDFWGYSYRKPDYDIAISEYRDYVETTETTLPEIAEMLSKGLVIGWFDGASEFGPRALGHRSILADPRHVTMWKRINAEIKYREDFRPLAPIVPLEEASDYFEIDTPSRYMLKVVQVKEEYKNQLAAICHVDGSARVQTVERELTPRIYDLLYLIKEKIGLPILLNTSLNVRGQPIVETPLQAIELLLATELDALFMDDKLIFVKKAVEIDLTKKLKISLPPMCKIIHETLINKCAFTLNSQSRGESYNLSKWCFELIINSDGTSTGQELFNKYLPADVSSDIAITWLVIFQQKRLIYISYNE